MRYLLDTDTCIEVLREREPVFSRIRSASPDDLAISSMTEVELRHGALNSDAPERRLGRVKRFLSLPLEVLPFDREGACWHAELRYALRATPIGERDLVIASLAVAQGLTLVTGNQRHFGRVPKLKTASWMNER